MMRRKLKIAVSVSGLLGVKYVASLRSDNVLRGAIAMPFLETCLTVLSVASSAAGLHSWFTGFKTGDQITQILQELQQTKRYVEQLSDHIFYAPSIQEVRDITQDHQNPLENGCLIRELLEPMQQAIDETILSSAIFSTPQKLQEAFGRNPWDVLFDITTVHSARRPSNPALVPILFDDGATQYVGWQTQGALPILFNCEYDPNRGLIVPASLSQSDSNSETTTEAQPIEQRMMRGRVKWWNDSKGFGFIEQPSGEDIFVHFSVIEGDGFPSLDEGQEVEFHAIPGPKGSQATRVRKL